MANQIPDRQKASDLILQFESEYDPFKYQIEDICIWPLFRFLAWEHIQINRDGLSVRHTSEPAKTPGARLNNSVKMLKEILQLQFLKLKRDSHDIIVLTTTDRLRDQCGKTYKNIYFDYIQPPLPNTLTFYVDFKTNRIPMAQPVVFASSRTVRPRVALATQRQAQASTKLKSLHRDLKSFLEMAGLSEAALLPLSTWQKRLAYFWARLESFTKIFEIQKPKFILTESYYDKMWAIVAANRLNIPVLELQHGIVYDGHMAYTFDPASTSKYRDRIPLPDKFLSFGRYFSEILLARGFWDRSQIVEVGLPRMEHYQTRFKYRPPELNEKLRVLISSQWILTDKLAEFLKAATARLPDNVVLSLKPHPYEQHLDKYRQINGLGVLKSDQNFYELLGKHHLHCSVFSTTLLESIGLGVPTMIIGLPGSENAIPLAEKSYCRLASSPEEFVTILGETAGNDQALEEWRQRTMSDLAYFWEPDASAKIRAIVSEE